MNTVEGLLQVRESYDKAADELQERFDAEFDRHNAIMMGLELERAEMNTAFDNVNDALEYRKQNVEWN